MHAPRRRRTTTTLNNDGYDPKNKSNGNKQTLYIIAGATAAILGLLILYKIFSSSSPSQVTETNNMDNLNMDDIQYYDDEELQEIAGQQGGFEGARGKPFGNMDFENLMNRRGDMFGKRKDKLFKNPLKDGRLSEKLERDRRRREEKMKRDREDREKIHKQYMENIENMKDAKKRRFDGAMPDALKARAGDLGLGGFRDKMGKINGDLEKFRNKMGGDGPFSGLGEGPIFRDGVGMDEDGNQRLSPDQIHAARERLKSNMRSGRFQGMPGMDGFDPDMMRRKREEM